MRNLLKADFLRIKNDILIKIVLLAAVGFALFTAFLYFIMGDVLGDELSSELGQLFDARTLFTSSFSISNNIGIAIPVILAIFMCKDFTYLTIRNKLIMGYNRSKVYLSSFIVSSVIGLLIITVYALCNLGFGSLLLGYGTAASNEWWVIIRTILLGWCIYLVLFSILSFMTFATKNMALTIICVITLTLVEAIVYSIIYVFSSNIAWVQTILSYLMMGQISQIADGSVSLTIVISSIIKILIINGLGILIFKKSDLK